MKPEFRKESLKASSRKIKPKGLVCDFPFVLKVVIEELKKCQTRIELLEKRHEKLRLKLE